MAKITALPTADLLTGDEHLPIVQGSSTKRVTMAAFRDLITPFLQYWYKGDQGETGASDNTYTTLAALLASDPTRKSARLVPEPGETAPAGNFNHVLGQWVRQEARGIQHSANVPGALSLPVSDELDSLAIRPEAFGATGTGLSDDTAALQAALNTGLNVRLSPGATYVISRKLEWSASDVSLTGAGKIKVAAWDFSQDPGSGAGAHLRMLFISGANVTISGVTFEALGVTPGDGIENGFIWSTGPHTSVTGCQFLGMPKGTCVWGLSSFLIFSNNTVRDCTGAVFVRGRSNTIGFNIIINATDAAIALNGRSCIGTTVIGNSISNETGAIIPAMIAVEEGASRFVIASNVMLGVNGGGISLINVLDTTSVESGIICNNELDARLADGTLPTTTNPAALLSVTDSYRGTKIFGNKIYGVPNGPLNSRAIVLPANETEFYDNVVDAAGASNLSAIIDILAGNGGLLFRDNKVVGFPGTRLVLINAGNYENVPLRFKGGRFLNGAEAINGELAIGSIMGLRIHIENIEQSTTVAFINAPTTIGYRGAFLNAGALQRPHKIADYTDMFGYGVPGHPGTMANMGGDTITYVAPDPGGFKGVVYTADGATWRNWGPIAA